VPFFNLAPIENAIERLKASARDYDRTLAAKADALSPDAKEKLVALAAKTEQAMIVEPGLPGGRGWYKNMIYAPGRFTGYGAKTLPGVREAIEDERWEDVDVYVDLTAKALNAYSDLLDQGVSLMGGAISGTAAVAASK
jgi:N-acetylated-alpha-linked acidic dipeptidase